MMLCWLNALLVDLHHSWSLGVQKYLFADYRCRILFGEKHLRRTDVILIAINVHNQYACYTSLVMRQLCLLWIQPRTSEAWKSAQPHISHSTLSHCSVDSDPSAQNSRMRGLIWIFVVPEDSFFHVVTHIILYRADRSWQIHKTRLLWDQ